MRIQHAAFFEHMAMIGGMLYVAAFGAGAFSLDGLLFRQKKSETRRRLRHIAVRSLYQEVARRLLSARR